MSVSGIDRVKRNYLEHAKDVSGRRTESAVFKMLSLGAENADMMTPQDTTTLVNSRYTPQITQNAGRTVGHVGYTAYYALWVHEAPGTLAGQPRAHFGRTAAGKAFGGGSQRGNYWDPPGAEPQFLVKGFEQAIPDFDKILKREYGV